MSGYDTQSLRDLAAGWRLVSRRNLNGDRTFRDDDPGPHITAIQLRWAADEIDLLRESVETTRLDDVVAMVAEATGADKPVVVPRDDGYDPDAGSSDATCECGHPADRHTLRGQGFCVVKECSCAGPAVVARGRVAVDDIRVGDVLDIRYVSPQFGHETVRREVVSVEDGRITLSDGKREYEWKDPAGSLAIHRLADPA